MNDAHYDDIEEREQDHDVGEHVRLCEYFYLPDPTQQRKNNEARTSGINLIVFPTKDAIEYRVEVENDEADVGAAEASLRKEESNVYQDSTLAAIQPLAHVRIRWQAYHFTDLDEEVCAEDRQKATKQQCANLEQPSACLERVRQVQNGSAYETFK